MLLHVAAKGENHESFSEDKEVLLQAHTVSTFCTYSSMALERIRNARWGKWRTRKNSLI